MRSHHGVFGDERCPAPSQTPDLLTSSYAHFIKASFHGKEFMKRTQMLAAVILTAALATPTQAVPPNLAQIVLTVTLDLLSLWEKASALVPKESLNHDITGKLKLYTYEQTERLRNGTVLKTTKEFINNSTLIGSTWTKIVSTEVSGVITKKEYLSNGIGDKSADFTISEDGDVPLHVRNFQCDYIEVGIIKIQTTVVFRVTHHMAGPLTDINNFIRDYPVLSGRVDFAGKVLPRMCSELPGAYQRLEGTIGSFRSSEVRIPTGSYTDHRVVSGIGMTPQSLAGVPFSNFSLVEATVRTDGFYK